MVSGTRRTAVAGISAGFVLFAIIFGGCGGAKRAELSHADYGMVSSPDGRVVVRFDVVGGRAVYSVSLDQQNLVQASRLGLVREDQSFADHLTWTDASTIDFVRDQYTMAHGKRANCRYSANRRAFTVQNKNGSEMDIVFQVSNDGVAFRYEFNDQDQQQYFVMDELSSFAFTKQTVSWLTPVQPGKSGWGRMQPSYEDYYEAEMPVGRPSTAGAGWALPGLFKVPDAGWVLIAESDVDGRYCAARLAHDSKGGIYHIDFPHEQEHRGPQDPVEPLISLPFASPWRILIVGETLGPIVESTLVSDLASPAGVDADFVKPGRASWHWLRYDNDSSTLPVVRSFLDFSAYMGWEYVLVDCDWDQNITREHIGDFVAEARAKGVQVILWYNSNGPWNDMPMTPKDRMHERSIRRQEMAWLEEIGVTAIKVDFFGGDKQATMQLYADIFEDAADFGIAVNVHGSTVPRGWHRTWPNFVTSEAVRGMEYVTFEQANADRQASHSTILPFTRNVVGPMDFTPVVLDPQIRAVQRQTTVGFEVACAVLFESGIQHFGLVPAELDLMPGYVVDFFRQVPAAWDDVRFIDGWPGDFVVMARRKGDTWYIAGINGLDRSRLIELDLSWLGDSAEAVMITDSLDGGFEKVELADLGPDHLISMQAQGGFTIIAR